MKLFNIPSIPRRWHHWFAWHPVVADGELIWLEPVERLWPDEFRLSGCKFFLYRKSLKAKA
jgi:hypothetical protein